MEKLSVRNLAHFAGVFNAFFMGAAFISGQETIQFFSSFGWAGLAGVALAIFIFIFSGVRIQGMARSGVIEEPFEVFEVVLGKRGGRIMTGLMFLVMTAEVIMMTSGAGAVAAESFGIPGFIGRAVVISAVAVVVILGLKRIVDVLGFIGPLNIVFLLFLAVVSLIRSPVPAAEGMEMLRTADVVRGAGTWWIAAVKYGCTALLSMMPVLYVCGKTARDLPEAKVSAVTQNLVLYFVWILVFFAQASNAPYIAGSEVPNVALALHHIPALHSFFSISILLGTFSAILMELWSVVQKVGGEGTVRYRAAVIILSAIALVLSGLLPFSAIVHYMYSILFWIGLVLFAAIVVHAVRGR